MFNEYIYRKTVYTFIFSTICSESTTKKDREKLSRNNLWIKIYFFLQKTRKKNSRIFVVVKRAASAHIEKENLTEKTIQKKKI